MKEFLKKIEIDITKDLIKTGILTLGGLITLGGAVIFFRNVWRILQTPLSLYWSILFMIGVGIVLVLYQMFSKKAKFNRKQRTINNTIVGHYRFVDLAQILMRKEITYPTYFNPLNLVSDNLLVNFLLFQKFLSVGISEDDKEKDKRSLFAYTQLVPELVTFDLVQQKKAGEVIFYGSTWIIMGKGLICRGKIGWQI